jgi:hypothetical protein
MCAQIFFAFIFLHIQHNSFTCRTGIDRFSQHTFVSFYGSVVCQLMSFNSFVNMYESNVSW